MKNVICINKGVWNKKDILRFQNFGSGSGCINDQGSEEIQTDTIDSILENNKVDFIKMDIEGSEYEALLGSYQTIQKYKPSLAISIYHKQDDFIKIPLLIKSLNSDYKLYFRQYRKLSVQETVCYAISKNKFKYMDKKTNMYFYGSVLD